MRILIMGLPGSGKSTLATSVVEILKEKNLDVVWLNADAVRSVYNDWDFSFTGRVRQARRMGNLANEFEDEGRIVICDFVCPLKELRELFAPQLLIWMNTITKSRYSDTDKVFEPAYEADYIIEDYSHPWEYIIAAQIIYMVNKGEK